MYVLVCTTWQSTFLGLLAGLTFGGLYGLGVFFPIPGGAYFGVLLGAMYGLGLGLCNGLSLGLVTCVIFYPLTHVKYHRWMSRLMGAGFSGIGVCLSVLLTNINKGMTPISALLIGFHCVTVSVFATLIGDALGYNLAQWYEKQTTARTVVAGDEPPSHLVALNKIGQMLTATLPLAPMGWRLIASLSFILSVFGYRQLYFSVCEGRTGDDCLSSPRLLTSAQAGFAIALPLFLVGIVLYSQYRVRLQIDEHRVAMIYKLFGYPFWTRSWAREEIRQVRLIRPRFGNYLDVALQVRLGNQQITHGQLTLRESQWLAQELNNWLCVPQINLNLED
ncbi:hypothetical protein H6F68_00225 [Trichocoleus sp. FACHB-262]|nr:hypothetical protein [Trichocoleus sp. FACHB-262]